MSKPRVGVIAPNNVHWLLWRKEHNIPFVDPSNTIKCDAEQLRKLKAAIRAEYKRKQGQGKD